MIMTDPMIHILRDLYSFARFSRNESPPLKNEAVHNNRLSAAQLGQIVIKWHSLKRIEKRGRNPQANKKVDIAFEIAIIKQWKRTSNIAPLLI